MKKTVICILCALWGCSDWYYQDEQPPEMEQVLENELVNDAIFIDSVDVGEIIFFKISGIERGNIFGEVYARNAKSSWGEQELSSGLGDRPDHLRWVWKNGHCVANYRDFLDDEEWPVDFSERENWPFKIEVGGVDYPLDEGFNIAEGTLHVTLTITQEMVANGHDLGLVVLQGRPREVQVGFVGFGSCEGRGGA